MEITLFIIRKQDCAYYIRRRSKVAVSNRKAIRMR